MCINLTPYNLRITIVTNTSWWRRGLKIAPRCDLDKLILCAFLAICAGTIVLAYYPIRYVLDRTRAAETT